MGPALRCRAILSPPEKDSRLAGFAHRSASNSRVDSVKKKFRPYTDVAEFYRFDPGGLDPLTVRVFADDITRLSAVREIRERRTRTQLTADRGRLLVYLATDDPELADSVHAKLVIQEAKNAQTQQKAGW